MRVGSLRWWFENRETGEITIAQRPNWPLVTIGLGWLVGRIAEDGSSVARVTAGVVTGLWLYWGAEEALRGVNPWRRVLGVAVVIWQLFGLLSGS